MRDNNDSFIEHSPQRIGSVYKPGSGYFYMKPSGPPDLFSHGGFQGAVDDPGERSTLNRNWVSFGALRPFNRGYPVDHNLDDSMGCDMLTKEDSGGY